jgi:hypothetical protein
MCWGSRTVEKRCEITIAEWGPAHMRVSNCRQRRLRARSRSSNSNTCCEKSLSSNTAAKTHVVHRSGSVSASPGAAPTRYWLNEFLTRMVGVLTGSMQSAKHGCGVGNQTVASSSSIGTDPEVLDALAGPARQAWLCM